MNLKALDKNIQPIHENLEASEGSSSKESDTIDDHNEDNDCSEDEFGRSEHEIDLADVAVHSKSGKD